MQTNQVGENGSRAAADSQLPIRAINENIVARHAATVRDALTQLREQGRGCQALFEAKVPGTAQADLLEARNEAAREEAGRVVNLGAGMAFQFDIAVEHEERGQLCLDHHAFLDLCTLIRKVTTVLILYAAANGRYADELAATAGRLYAANTAIRDALKVRAGILVRVAA